MFRKIKDKERIRNAEIENKRLKLINDELMIALVELDAQRDIDKTESELAVAELAETILGGI